MKHLLCLYLKCGSRPVMNFRGDVNELTSELEGLMQGNNDSSHLSRFVDHQAGTKLSVLTDQIVGYSIQPAQEAT